MTPEPVRLDPVAVQRLAPETWRALIAISTAAKKSGLGDELIELVKLRASLLNGCHYCIAMHTGISRGLGVSEQRIQAVEHWRDSDLFSPRERAAFAWTDGLTHLAKGGVPNSVYREASEAFSETDLAALTSVVVSINAWNRIALAYGFQPETEAGGRR
ncbi:carboxymuconolactone decarboxylase family protein [Hyalangium rubrum]|uniref:Carboxymuconolactone decarboxylase family protein n=1 Tax=Hyalangium rubrum TaxID=3103134 RepID=A0ABU5H039_9BACT|nr:carboxymuconolactone decarboxylase family protein [Hyalangium sp. s54d21]MDY7226676.1 carboxymuconolactone decarboxylase family protein [Hyalangium sp. s54d21]